MTVVANPANGGTVTGSGTFAVGSTQTITATPSLPWVFTGWNDGNTQATRTVTVPSGGVTYTANFYVDNTLTIFPTVSIAAGVAETEENSGRPATFVLTCSASSTGSPTFVRYQVKGSGQNGVDFEYLSGTVKVKAFKYTKVIKVTPIDRGISGGGKVTVKLVLSAGTGYYLGTPTVAKVKIVDGD